MTIYKVSIFIIYIIKCKINIEDVVVLTNEPIDGLYSSIHLIVNISMTYTDQKYLTEYINATTDFVLDTKVYTDYRLFRCINQSKLSKTPMRLLSKHTILETLVNITDHLPIYTFNLIYTPPNIRTIFVVKTPTELIEHFLTTQDTSLFEKIQRKYGVALQNYYSNIQRFITWTIGWNNLPNCHRIPTNKINPT